MQYPKHSDEAIFTMSTWQKMLAGFLAVALVGTMVPVLARSEAQADEEAPETETVAVEADAASEQSQATEDGLPENANEKAVMGSSIEESEQEAPVTEESVDDAPASPALDPTQENSWRYVDGELLEAEYIDTAGEGIMTFSIVKDGAYDVFNWFDTVGGLCPSASASRGIDVSEHNKVIDWAEAKRSGVNFAIIRCGYGQDYRSQDDKYWIQNVQGCVKNGIPFGVYLYSYAKDTTMAASEAQHVLTCLKQVSTGGYLKLPIYYDMEDANLAAQSNATLAAMAKTFCTKIKSAGYDVGVYANTTWWNTRLTDSCFNSWKRWVAQYNTYGVQYSGFNKANDIWQFTSKGVVGGISGNVDLNYSHISSLPKTTLAASWVQSGNRWWYRYADGTYPANCAKVIGGKTYRFDASGWMRTGWVKEGSNWYWHGAWNDGAMKTGWVLLSGHWYYMDPSTGAMKTGFYDVSGKRYYSDSSGVMKTGWLKSGGSWYWLQSNGAMAKGWVLLADRNWYYLDPSTGVLKTGWFTEPSGRKFYSNSSGVMQKGWLKSGGSWYWLQSNGAMAKGWVLLADHNWYYMDPSTGVMKTGWFTEPSGRKFYSNSSGVMQKGWLKSGGKWYYLMANGAMATNRWISGIYWVGSDGVMATSAWVDNNRYYVNANGVWVPNAKR